MWLHREFNFNSTFGSGTQFTGVLHANLNAQVGDAPPGGEMAVWRVGLRFQCRTLGKSLGGGGGGGEGLMSRCYLSGPMAALQDGEGVGGQMLKVKIEIQHFHLLPINPQYFVKSDFMIIFML